MGGTYLEPRSPVGLSAVAHVDLRLRKVLSVPSAIIVTTRQYISIVPNRDQGLFCATRILSGPHLPAMKNPAG
jgi:hypothetical protein